MYQKQNEFKLFAKELIRVNSHLERIKWCLNEQTNVYAFKIAVVREISEIRMDEKIEGILAKFREKWPYQPMDYYRERNNGHIRKLTTMFKKRLGSDDANGGSKMLNMDLSLIRNQTDLP